MMIEHPAITAAEKYGYPKPQKAVCQCSECDEPIYEGESAYYLTRWGWVCEACMSAAYKVVEL